MEKLHIQKQSFSGYCVGTGVEYPGIIVHAKSDECLTAEFLQALPGHQKALDKINNKPENISVIEIEPNQLAK